MSFNRISTFSLLFAAFLIGCQNDASKSMNQLDLLGYGIPMTILAPDSAEVKTMDMGFMKDVTVKKGKEYSIQILASEANTTSVEQVKALQLSEVQKNPFFSQIITDLPNGFIYENRIDSTHINYGFRYVHIQGGQEYVFQTGMIGDFSQESVEEMYEAVKQ